MIDLYSFQESSFSYNLYRKNVTGMRHTVQQFISHLQKMREKLEFGHPFYINTEIAYEIILQEILFGDLKPGERVPQENLASMLN